MEAVFRRYYARLVYFAASIIHDRQEAEDLAMKAMSALWENAISGTTIDNMESYVFTIVRNGCYDFLKHEKIKAGKKSELIGEETGNDIEAAFIQEEVINTIYHEIMSLPERCREVATLAYIKGLDSSEIAQQLNITLSTVRSQKARARELLKTALIRNKLACCWLLLFFL